MKVKYTKACGNDCVPRSLAKLLNVPRKQVASELPMTKAGVRSSSWMSYAKKQGLTVKKMKNPTPTTLEGIQQISKGHKSGIVARVSSDAGSHTFFVKNGVIHDDAKKANKNSIVMLHAIASKD